MNTYEKQIQINEIIFPFIIIISYTNIVRSDYNYKREQRKEAWRYADEAAS